MMEVVCSRGAICMALGFAMCRQVGISPVYGQRSNYTVLTLRGVSGAVSMVRAPTDSLQAPAQRAVGIHGKGRDAQS